MKVETIPLTSFVHDSINAIQDQPTMMEESTARELERAGLLRIKFLDRRVDRALTLAGGAQVVPGKVTAAGEAQPSSSLPPAPHSQSTTLPTSQQFVRGSGKRRRTGT